MGRLEGKIAIITGAGSGMGLAAAELFAREGAKVAGFDKDIERLEALVEKRGLADAITPFVFDVTDEAGWDDMVAQVVDRYGLVNVLVNNAGYNPGAYGVLDTTREIWNAVVDTCMTAVWFGMRAVIPFMQQAGGGSIVNTSSLAGLLGGAADGYSIAYSAAKGGVRSMTRHAANRFGKDYIRVNCVLPGQTNTSGIGYRPTPEAMAELQEEMSHGAILPLRCAESIDQAYAYLYFASDESRFVTGTELVVDGGWASH